MKAKMKNSWTKEELEDLRNKMQVASLLVGRKGLSGRRAGELVGVPFTSCNRYLKKGLPDGPIWPDDSEPRTKVLNQYNQIAATLDKQSGSSNDGQFQRDGQGKFLPGHAPTTNRLAIQARADLEKFAPDAVKKFLRAFRSLSPSEDPILVLQFSRELFDRVLGKPKQSVDVNSSNQTWESYGWLEDIIQSKDTRSLELAAALAASMAHYSGHPGFPFVPGPVEIVPPPVPAEQSSGPGGDGEVSSPDNQHASSTWKVGPS